MSHFNDITIQQGGYIDAGHALIFKVPTMRAIERPAPTEALRGCILFNTDARTLEICDGERWTTAAIEPPPGEKKPRSRRTTGD